MPSPYQTLDQARKQIRRLILSPGEFDSPLVARLDVLSLVHDLPQYEALSYVWGQELAPAPMAVNGVELPVTSNLDCALRYLRHGSEERVLWVDAVCIDQSNLVEKAQQVGLMTDIYSSSSVVLVWLGPPTEDSDIAMKSIADFNRDYWQTLPFQIHFIDVLGRPWFTRIWTVQEFALGRNHPMIGCGYVWVNWLSFWPAWAWFTDGMEIVRKEWQKEYHNALIGTFSPDWKPEHPQVTTTMSMPIDEKHIIRSLRVCFGEDFVRCTGHGNTAQLTIDLQQNLERWKAREAMMRYREYHSPLAKTYWKGMTLYERVSEAYHTFLYGARRSIVKQGKHPTFMHIFKGTMNLHSTDARDKIYGMLGLVSPKARNSIPVDYAKPWWWSFTYTMTYLLSEEKDALELVGLLWWARPFTMRFPSWCPNFTITARWENPHSPILLRGSCINEAWSWPENYHLSVNRAVLSASGLSFGKAVHLIPFVNGSRQENLAQLQSIETHIKERCPCNEPIWRTLVGIRNTSPDMLAAGLAFDERWETLLGRSDHTGRDTTAFGYAEDLLGGILDNIRGKVIFTTDQCWAGVSTPDIQLDDTVAIIFGMVRPALLREIKPQAINVKTDLGDEDICYRRIVGFSYVGCKNRDGFEKLQQQKSKDWRKHSCFQYKKIQEFHII